MRRPGSGKTSSNGACLKGVAISVSSRLRLSVVEITPVDECIMRLRLRHTLGFVSCCSVCSYRNVWG